MTSYLALGPNYQTTLCLDCPVEPAARATRPLGFYPSTPTRSFPKDISEKEQNEKGNKGLGSTKRINPNQSSHSPGPGQLFQWLQGISWLPPFSREGCLKVPYRCELRTITSQLLPFTSLREYSLGRLVQCLQSSQGC